MTSFVLGIKGGVEFEIGQFGLELEIGQLILEFWRNRDGKKGCWEIVGNRWK